MQEPSQDSRQSSAPRIRLPPTAGSTSWWTTTSSDAENAKNAEDGNDALQVDGYLNVGAVLGGLGALGVERGASSP